MANCYQSFQYDNDREASASSKPMNLKLIFSTRVASPVFTGRNMSGEAGGDGGNQSIKVILVDSETHQQVITGPAAFATVKIVLIRGDFAGGVWTPLDFQTNIVVNWGRKTNLLLGDLNVFLKEGSGTVGEIRIKHDSNPLKNGKFRLGAMVIDGCPHEVKEAITDPFEVKDRRNESKDSRRLSPEDKVCHLKNIRKRGPIEKRLKIIGVLTVSDFVNMHTSNPRALQETCRIKGKRWDMTVNHAKKIRVENVLDGYGSVESTSQLSNNMSSFDHNGYTPQPYEDDQSDNMMPVDGNHLSVQDYEECGLVESITFEANEKDGMYGASTMVSYGGSGAKKRWMKLRATLWFSVVSFMKKVGLCVGATLAG